MDATLIGRLRARGTPPGPAARLALASQLAAADLRPSGAPPSAVLIVRSLADPKPGALRARAGPPRPDPAWERAVRERLGVLYRGAARPLDGPVPANAEAVVFRDGAEMVACLARDLRDGTQRWWWRALLARRPELGDLAGLCVHEARQLPAALVCLRATGEDARVLDGLSEREADAVLEAVAREFGQRDEIAARTTAGRLRQSGAVAKRAPEAVETRRGGGKRPSLDSFTPQQGVRLPDIERPATPEGVCSPDVELPTPSEGACPPDMGLPTPPEGAGTFPEARSEDPARAARSAAAHPRVPVSDPSTPSTPATPDDTVAAGGRRLLESVLRALEDGIRPSPGEESPTVGDRVAGAERDEGFLTHLGGVFYLVHVLRDLQLPLSWATLELLARDLLADVSDDEDDWTRDPLWDVLAELDGRAPGEPANVPEGWDEMRDAVRRRLAEALDTESLEDSDVARVLRVRGKLFVTRTHVDLVLPLEAADLAVRRAGLDADPGWVPELRRVVHFFFEN